VASWIFSYQITLKTYGAKKNYFTQKESYKLFTLYHKITFLSRWFIHLLSTAKNYP